MTYTPGDTIEHPATGYPVAAVTGLVAGVGASIPYPPQLRDRQATVPLQIVYCVIANASPFTLLVTSGANITQIPAFTADAVHVYMAQQQQAISVLPQATGAIFNPGVDTSVYATWYEKTPPGTYPCSIGAGTTPISTSEIILSRAASTIGAGPVTIGPADMTVQPWMQGMGIKFGALSSGTGAIGVMVSVLDPVTFSWIVGGADRGLVVTSDQWLWFPINGQAVSITISPINGTGIGGSINGGTIQIVGTTGPILRTELGNQGTDVALTNFNGELLGQTTGGVAVASGATVTLITVPVPGFVIRVNNISWRFTVAPNQNPVFFRGGAAADSFFTFTPTGVIESGQMNGGPFLVAGNTGAFRTTESLQVVNQTNQTVTVIVAYDVIAFSTPE